MAADIPVLAEILAQQAALTAAHFRAGQTVKLYVRQQQGLQGRLADLGTPPGMACHRGCSACCRQTVACTWSEVISLADYLRATVARSAWPALRALVTQVAEQERQLSDAQRWGLPCVLLEEERGTCRAYEHRPGACRGAYSPDAAVCAARMDGPQRVQSLGALAVGEIQGFRESRLPAYLVTLGIGLEIALAHPDAEARVHRGEDLFRPAHIRPALRGPLSARYAQQVLAVAESQRLYEEAYAHGRAKLSRRPFQADPALPPAQALAAHGAGYADGVANQPPRLCWGPPPWYLLPPEAVGVVPQLAELRDDLSWEHVAIVELGQTFCVRSLADCRRWIPEDLALVFTEAGVSAVPVADLAIEGVDVADDEVAAQALPGVVLVIRLPPEGTQG